MTLHTIRGSTGIIKQLYVFHANIVTSSDMGIFMAVTNGANIIAHRLNELKRDAVMKTRALYYATLISGGKTGVVQWIWLYDAWAHHLDFHAGIYNTILPPVPEDQEKELECIWET